MTAPIVNRITGEPIRTFELSVVVGLVGGGDTIQNWRREAQGSLWERVGEVQS